ncbi:MAG: helix-turn-helix transcriptional regulator [Pyrinomonadaceae bacterium MAG19_C2-C3]|nr:helix-turn-helix transcriptional regulator [Pyrinomonadaceae bacterium MAG19_C2-C3]
MYRTDLINAAMGARRMTAEELAKRTGLGMTVISAVRNGKPNPKIDTLKRIADALDLQLADLFTHDAAQEPVAA